MTTAPPTAPGLELSLVRTLNLRSHPDGRSAHVAAASGIVQAGSNTYVVADDELHIGVFRSATSEPGELQRIFAGTLPAGPKARKKAKPDVEALALMPATRELPAGALLGLGSGSTAQRRRGFMWALDSHQSLSGAPRTVDLASLYAELAPLVQGTLNIEGVAVRGDEAMLFHRGNSKGGRNAVARVAVTRLLATDTDRRSLSAGPSALRGVVNYDLGSIDGVPLTFADAHGLPDGRVLFLATAERTDHPVDDGAIAGSAVGLLGNDGSLGKMWPVAGQARKLEGVDVAYEPDGTARLMLVTDADDPAKPAELLRATLPMDLARELANANR